MRLYILSLCLASLAAAAPLECPRNGALYPDLTHCGKFYMCSGGDAYSMECPPGTHFSLSILICDHAHNVDCLGRPQEGVTTTTTARPEMTTTAATTTTAVPTTTTTQKPGTTPSTTTTARSTTTTANPTTTREKTTTTTADPTTTKPMTTTARPTTTTVKPTTTTAKPTTTTAKPTTTTAKPTTTTAKPATTAATTTVTTTRPTTTLAPSAGIRPYPEKAIGMYIVLADDGVEGYETENSDWEPKLYQYQQEGANVLFFTFINPESMTVPKSFEKLAKSRGTGLDGAVPEDTVIIFAIGGLKYSTEINPWQWLTSQQAAESMAEEVATWVDRYGMDGIDLDIEEGAGFRPEAGPNMVHFIRKLKQLHPEILVGQPTYGYPQIAAEIEVINESWDLDGSSHNLASSVGIMVYEGTTSLNYVVNFAAGTEQWEGFPITTNVHEQDILVGAKGTASYSDIQTLARESVKQNLLGIMVWYASVRGGFQYETTWDTSMNEDSQKGFVDALAMMRSGSH